MTVDTTGRFVADGFVAVRAAVAADVVLACRNAIEAVLRERGIDPNDAATWKQPVVRIPCPQGDAFASAGLSPRLGEVYDALLGAGNWIRRAAVGGTVPVRLPSDDPGDAGWHIDGSFDVDGSYWVNVRSRGRALLALFLFTDVCATDAPTEVLVGSHLDVPRVLAPFGDDGVPFGRVTAALPPSTFERPSAPVTGRAGDVFVCHPFLVHRATWPHRGKAPRIVAQPEVGHLEPFALTPDGASAVERAILVGLAEK